MKVRLSRKNYRTLNTIEVSESALLHNYNYLSSLGKQVSVAPAVKSNAYGHGLRLVAKVLDTVGAPFFCVDSLHEAYALMKIHIKTPILIMGYTNPNNFKIKKLPFKFAVYDKETVAVLNRYQKNAAIHIFVDTGMHREGIPLAQLPDFITYIRTLKNIKVEGIMSHFATSEEYDDDITQEQLKNFQLAQEIIRDVGYNPEWIHIGNSSAALAANKQYEGKIGKLVRTGLSLYGIDPLGKDTNLRPVMTVKTTLSQIKKLIRGEKVGYNSTYSAEKDIQEGILPYGYYDGLDRRFSNNGVVLINNTECPIIGRVSMNITTIDISNVKNPSVGDSVIIYSNNPSDKNSFYNAAKRADTIPNVLLVKLSETTRRILVA